MKWIEIREVPRESRRKTSVYLVKNKETAALLGTIEWYTPFRKYSFFPRSGMVFEYTCLTDIAEFLNKLMEERKVKKWDPRVGDRVMSPSEGADNPVEVIITFIYPPKSSSIHIMCRVMEPDTKVEWDVTLLSLSPIKS